MEKKHEPKRPKGWTRALYRLPLKFYQIGLGALMGGRFIHLIHTGRESGFRRDVVLEVVEYIESDDIYYLASGWGKGSDWYRNILKTPQVEAQVGRRKLSGRASPVQPEQAAEVFSRYGQRHPRALQTLARGMGYHIETNDTEYRALGREIPVVAIHVDKDNN